MKLDVTIPLVDHKGKPIRVNDKDEKGATLRDVLELVCIAPSEELKRGDEKLKVYRILQRVTKADPELELEASEIEILKKLIGAMYPAVLVGVLYDALEAPSSVERPAAAESDPPGPPRRSAGRGR